MSASTKFVRRVWKSFVDNKGHDFTSFGHAEITRAVPGLVEAKMTVKPHQINRMNTLHGGVICSLVDTMGSLALSSNGLYMTGVSVDIHVSFVRGVPLSEDLIIKASVVNQGKTLAYTKVDIENAKTGKMLAYGSHTKFIRDALKSDQNVKFSPDGESEVD